MLQVEGCLERSQLTYSARHPVIMPPSCRISELILRYVHASVGHLGCDSVLANVRQKFWILKASILVKEHVKKCVVCRKYQAFVMGQEMAALPTDWTIGNEPPFTRSDVDYFRPFLIKSGRSLIKRYGVIFTCFACRAVHIEKAFSLYVSSCIDAIRRFI